MPNTGVAVKRHPQPNAVASRNPNFSQDKAELASLIETVVNDMIEQKCNVYTKKYIAQFSEDIVNLKRGLVKLVQKVDMHNVNMDQRLVSIEQQIEEARALAVNVRNGINDEDRARMDTIELKLQSLAMDKSNTQEDESRDLRRYVKDFVKRIKLDISNLEKEIERVDGRVVHLNNTTNQRFLEHVDLLEVLEDTVQRHDQFVNLSRISANTSIQDADHILQNMSTRLNTLGNTLSTAGGQAQTDKFQEGLLSPLQGTSTGNLRLGEQSLIYDDTLPRGESIAVTPTSMNTRHSANGMARLTSTSHNVFAAGAISAADGRSLCERLDTVEKTLRSLKHLRSQVSNCQNTAESYSKVFDELTALKTHVSHLGESTALACKHLTSGLTDIQETSMDTTQWAQLISEYIDEFVNKVAPQHKQLCPKIKYTKYDSQHVNM